MANNRQYLPDVNLEKAETNEICFRFMELIFIPAAASY